MKVICYEHLYSEKTAMKRWALRVTSMSLFLLWSLLLNWASCTADNNTAHDVSPLLALISVLHQRPRVIQSSKAHVKSPAPDILVQSQRRPAKLTPLLVAKALRAMKLSRTQHARLHPSPEGYESQPEVRSSPSRAAASGQLGVFYRV